MNMETKLYVVNLKDGGSFNVRGNKLVILKNGDIEIMQIAGEGQTAADNVIVAVVAQGNTVHIEQNLPK